MSKLFDEGDYFMCSQGIMPAKIKASSHEMVKHSGGKKYLTHYDLTCNGADFSCRWMVLLAAIVAAAIAALMSNPAGWVLLAAMAGAAGGALLAGALCGSKAAVLRVWVVIKVDAKIGPNKGNAVVNRPGIHMECHAFQGDITYVPNIKYAWQAWFVGIGNTAMVGLEAFCYVFAAKGIGKLFTAPKAFFFNFGVNYLKSWSVQGAAVRLLFGGHAASMTYFLSSEEGANAGNMGKAAFHGTFFIESAVGRLLSGESFETETERYIDGELVGYSPKGSQILPGVFIPPAITDSSMGFMLGGIAAGGKNNNGKPKDANYNDVKNAGRQSLKGYLELGRKATGKGKGTGAFEKKKPSGGDGPKSEWGDTKGEFSERWFFKDRCGGEILKLDWKSAIITKEGIETVKKHVSRFEPYKPNEIMIERLEKIERGEIEVTDFDKRYYTHEMQEFERYNNMGIDPNKQGTYENWNDAHTATLEDFQINEIEQPLYHPDAIID